MGQIIKIILIILTFSQCKPSKDEKKETRIENNSNQGRVLKHEIQNNQSLFIKDSSDYSMNFINGLMEAGLDNFSLIDDYLILNQDDTVSFPETPKIGEAFHLKGNNEMLEIELILKRINQTTIDFDIIMFDLNKSTHHFEGQADLKPLFYFGSETDVNSKSGNSYLSTEFFLLKDTCYTYIRIGNENGTETKLLGKIVKNCNGKIFNIDLDNFPTLQDQATVNNK